MYSQLIPAYVEYYRIGHNIDTVSIDTLTINLRFELVSPGLVAMSVHSDELNFRHLLPLDLLTCGLVMDQPEDEDEYICSTATKLVAEEAEPQLELMTYVAEQNLELIISLPLGQLNQFVDRTIITSNRLLEVQLAQHFGANR